MDTVIRGADFVELWNKVSKVVEMPSSKWDCPVIAYTDFKDYKGKTGSHGIRESGGFFSAVPLDCSNQKGLHRVKVAMNKTWIRDNNWSAIEEAFEAAGQTMYDEILGSIITELLTDVATGFTDTVANWGASHYKSLVKGLSLVAGKHMYPNIVLIHPDELYDLMILDYFVHANYSALAAKQAINPVSGLAGYLFPNSTPIYFTPKCTAASMIIADAKRASVLGVRQDLTIENFDDVLKGEEGAVLTMQYDVKSGKDAKPTSNIIYAWAVVTAA